MKYKIGNIVAIASLASLGLAGCGHSDDSSSPADISNAPSATSQASSEPSESSVVSGESSVATESAEASGSEPATIAPQNPDDLNDSEKVVRSKIDELSDISVDVMKNPSTSMDRVITPYFNGDTRGMTVVSMLSLGLEISNIHVGDDGEMSMNVVGPDRENLIDLEGYYLPETQQLKISSVTITEAGDQYLSDHAAEIADQWATN